MSKILVIDDDEGLRRTLDAALRFFGYEVSLASDGPEGLRQARAWQPDLVLCDVNMPGMDGREVLQIFRNDSELADRQFILMTGNQQQNPQREGMNLGADDYLPKPFEIAQLRTCVQARLRRSEIYRRLEDGMLRRHAELFGSTLPHEFMTPLNGILGFAEILKEDIGKLTTEESVQMLGDIESCARRLHRTLHNYITLVSIENGSEGAHPPPAPVLAPEEAAQIIASVSQTIADRAGRISDLALEPDPVAIRCREGDLPMIAEHLVQNAFSYSQPGTPVFVTLKAGRGSAVLTIRDRGRGMTAAQIEQIGLFMQFDRKRFEQQGLGIGLAIVKRLAARNSAKISFESVPLQGTAVTVEFQEG